MAPRNSSASRRYEGRAMATAACEHRDAMAETPVTQRPRPKRGEELEVRIDSLAHGGAGVGRAEGFVVFVRGTVPGDHARVRVDKAKRSFAEASVVELIEPSPDRIEPRAPHPGASWQVLPYERQLEEKERQVREALSRIGGVEGPPRQPLLPGRGPPRPPKKPPEPFRGQGGGRGVRLPPPPPPGRSGG